MSCAGIRTLEVFLMRVTVGGGTRMSRCADRLLRRRKVLGHQVCWYSTKTVC